MAIIAAAVELDKDLMKQDLTSFEWVLLCLALLVAALVVGWLFGRIVETSWLARRLVLGKNDMESDWTDLAIDRETGELINVAFTRTTYRKGYFCLDGIAWYPEDNLSLSWRTIQSEYADDKLLYRYETWWARDLSDKEHGAGVIEFERDDERIERYVGKFIDSFHMRRCAHYGARVRYPLFRSQRLTSEQKLERAQAYCDARLPALRRELGFVA